MPRILTAPDRLTAAEKRTTTTLYLAGPFDAGDRSWRDDVIAGCADLDVTIVDPRNPRWATLEPGSPGRRGAYDWQCAAALDADVVIVWIPDGSAAPTALMLLGYLAAKRGGAKKGSSVVVGGDGVGGLPRLFAQNQQLFPVGGELGEVIRIARLQLGKAAAAKPRA